MSTTTCAKCRDNFPLPVAMDYFDQRVIADYTQRRTACTAAPDAAKPCLKPAPTAIHMTERQKTGLQATWQADSLLRALMHAAHHGDVEGLSCLLRAMLQRLLDLNGVSMSAHDPDSDSLPVLHEQLHGGYQGVVLGVQGGAA
jgi:hypothetical protein